MNYDKLTETLRQHGVSCVRAYGRYCSICDEAATALSTLKDENEKLREKIGDARLKGYAKGLVEMSVELARVTAERDALIKRTAGDCWSCIRRYECNNRKGPHKRCWEFDPWLLRED